MGLFGIIEGVIFFVVVDLVCVILLNMVGGVVVVVLVGMFGVYDVVMYGGLIVGVFGVCKFLFGFFMVIFIGVLVMVFMFLVFKRIIVCKKDCVVIV